jgi:cleavage and polyadenylation specificity factor subunit 2
MNSKVPLHGIELEEYLEAERLQKERQAAQQAALDRSRRMLEADDLDSDSDSDEDDDLTATDNLLAIGNTTRGGDSEIQMSFDIFVKGQQMRVARGKEDQGTRFRMFPFMERRGKKVDAYGETLDVGQWVRKGREIEEEGEGETKEVSDAKKKKEEEGERAVSLLLFRPVRHELT